MNRSLLCPATVAMAQLLYDVAWVPIGEAVRQRWFNIPFLLHRGLSRGWADSDTDFKN